MRHSINKHVYVGMRGIKVMVALQGFHLQCMHCLRHEQGMDAAGSFARSGALNI